MQPESRNLTYKPDGVGKLPPPRNEPSPVPVPPERDADIGAGRRASVNTESTPRCCNYQTL